MRVQDYTKLVVWQRAHQYVLTIYELCPKFPDDERYGVTGQLKRAVVSIPANIAEGCGRETQAELRRFLYISMGSASEVEYYLRLIRDLKFINVSSYEQLFQELSEIRRMLNTLIQKTNN
jgi:four helix bundle protein